MAENPEENSKIDVDFSLAVHTKTGKYFIGRDLIENCADLIEGVYYWKARLKSPPGYFFGKILGRFQRTGAMATLANTARLKSIGRVSKRPMLHLDPFTILTNRLVPHDIVLCHDVGPLTHPELFEPEMCRAYGVVYAHIAEIGPNVVFVSQASRDTFNKTLGYPSLSSSAVIYPPLRQIAASVQEARIENITQPFLLTVGSLGTRKNQATSIRAFKQSGLYEQGFSYVICGGQEPGYDDVVKEARTTPGVTILPYVSEATLHWLYRAACGFVLMSRLEGFGIPVAEAISHDLIPLVSRNSVLHEVAGDGALLADENDAQEIARSMQTMVSLPAGERARRLASLHESIRRFDVEAFGREWRSFIENVLVR